MNDKPQLLFDTGNQTRCFTYVDDAVDGVILIAEKSEAEGCAFNLGNKIENKVSEAIEMIQKELSDYGRINSFDTRG